MKSFAEYIGLQFGKPNGLIGKICCHIMNIMNKPLYDSVIENIDAEKNITVLDIGYGNGYLISRLLRKSHCNIYGIDISEDMKKLAEKRNIKAISENKLHLLTGDCCSMDFDDNSFDAVTSVNTIYFWQDTLKGFSEIYRTLKPKGKFYNAVYSKKWLKKYPFSQKGFKFFEKEDFIDLGKQAGFSKTYICDIKKDKSYLVIFEK